MSLKLENNKHLLSVCRNDGGFYSPDESAKIANDLLGRSSFSRPDIEARDEFGNTPLLLAAFHGNRQLIPVLLGHGADIEAREHEKGRTALMLAASRGHSLTCDALLALGANASARNDEGTALHAALSSFNLETIDALIEGGIDINAPNKWGNTALHIAAGRRMIEVCAKLLEAGADPSLKNDAGQTPSDIATPVQSPEINALLRSHRAKRMLQEALEHSIKHKPA